EDTFYAFFFFQAEDGIRDFHVTGVQTCALPIFAEPAPKVTATSPSPARAVIPRSAARVESTPVVMAMFPVPVCAAMPSPANSTEIGRASCRERVEIWVGVEREKKGWKMWVVVCD